MDLNASRRRLSPPHRTMTMKSGLSGIGSMKIFIIACFIALSALITISMIYQIPPADQMTRFAQAIAHNVTSGRAGAGDSSQPAADMPKDKLLGGLLHAGFDQGSCLSRYQSVSYHKVSAHKPSPHLLSRLRSYEDLHKRCGPHTKSYNKTLESLAFDHSNDHTECSYVVWASISGLGNRILTMASAFLYALLTNRVLLVEQKEDMNGLFCEPFPDTSWLLPKDFPIKDQFKRFYRDYPNSYGNMLKNNNMGTSTEIPHPYLYLHLLNDYTDHDKLFFCDQDQMLLKKVPWLIMKSDNYFVPSLFLISSFKQELKNLFPEKEAVFHHLVRYLFHPSNQVWGLITRYYEAYLSKADEKIGIQIRNFDSGTGPFEYVMDQIFACIRKEKLLPEVSTREFVPTSSKNHRTKAVLMTSLISGYFEKVRNKYWEHPTVTGDIIGVYQPSHEEYQNSEKLLHNMKAWSEMYLLSFTDVLVTSARSTFGYVAQGLGGLKPWLLYMPENRTAPDPPCGRVVSMEPCFHSPPYYDCKAKKGIDIGTIVSHVRHCEDISWGIKLFDSNDEF